MPNWTENYVEISGNPESVKELKELVKNGERLFSFNKILPMPDALCITSGSLVFRGLQLLDEGNFEALMSLDPSVRAEVRRAVGNMNAYGVKDWYDWCNFHWGTKWDACDVFMSDHPDNIVTYSFNTAWTGPEPVARALREMFPELEISWRCLDEDATAVRNEEVEDEDDEDAWIYPCLDENPNTYEI